MAAFTLIEVLTALAIAAIGLLGLARLHLMGLNTARAVQTRTAAIFLAQEKITDACAGGYPRLGTQSGVDERDGTQFEWTTSIEETHPQLTAGRNVQGLREVRTTISWPQGSGYKEVRMTTSVAESRFGG
jgi:type II secretion system protein I